jgi:Methyltransferase domain
MPASAEEGRDIMQSWIRAKYPRSILDIGAGSGTYAKLWQNVAPRPYLIGVEIWEPYVEGFDLHRLYDQVIIQDVRSWKYKHWPRADVVILGDVLEHMERADAIRVWSLATTVAHKAVYLSIPTVPCPQGEVHGNPHEEHVISDWTHDQVLATFPGISWYWQGSIVGRYEADLRGLK